jgi:hypothetical protein
MTAPDRGPIETATGDLLDWLERAAGESARLAAPSGPPAEGLALWPLELRPQRQTRGCGPHEPFRFGVRYLLTATGAGALRLLDRVLAAAVTQGAPEIALEAGDRQLWQVLQTPPRPALFIDVPVQVTQAVQAAPPVLHALQLRHVARITVSGRIVGPRDEPLAAMRVEVVGGDASRSRAYPRPPRCACAWSAGGGP